jgi:hypothetical protein
MEFIESRDPVAANVLGDAVVSFKSYKALAERALDQVDDEQFFNAIDPESNSLAIMVKHISGNLRSRWTDFLTTDGEKPDRARDTEFELMDDSRETLMNAWDSVWETLFDTLSSLRPEDLGRSVTIRSQPHTVVEAINRQLTHYAYHVGQIVFLCKHLRSSDWKTLSVPRNRSAEFNKFLEQKIDAGEETERGLGSIKGFEDK